MIKRFKNILNEAEQQIEWIEDTNFKYNNFADIILANGGVKDYDIRKFANFMWNEFVGKKVKFFTDNGEVEIIVDKIEIGIEKVLKNGAPTQLHAFYFFDKDNNKYSIKVMRKLIKYKKYNSLDPYGEENW